MPTPRIATRSGRHPFTNATSHATGRATISSPPIDEITELPPNMSGMEAIIPARQAAAAAARGRRNASGDARTAMSSAARASGSVPRNSLVALRIDR